MCTKFQLSRLIFIFINCFQLLRAINTDNSWYDKILTGIFMCTLKLICVPNFSFLSWFSISSAFTTCNQLLTADKKMTRIFMYTLKLLPVPNLGSPGWYSISSTVISCHQLFTADNSWYEKKYWNFYVQNKV